MTKYIGDDLPSKVSDLVNISIEAVIAEIVDNSLDKKSSKVEVIVSGKDWDDFSIVTYDNSPIGFSSEEELDTAFRMGGKKERSDDDIGSFHMGAKSSTLSKFRDIAIFTKIGSDFYHRRMNKVEIGEIYKPEKNQTYPLAEQIQKKIKKEDYTTAFVCYNPLSRLFNSDTQIKKSSIDGFCEGLSLFLGIIYEKILTANPNLTIMVNNETVKPVDPFWRNFTSSAMSERLDLQPGQDGYVHDAMRRNILECAVPWGTIATEKVSFDIDVEGSSYPIQVQGFVIPYGEVRKKLEKYELTSNEFLRRPNKAGTDTLKTQFMQGFFFYREGRCIGFGNTGKNSNDGWYLYGGGRGNTSLGVRFMVDFPKELDKFMRLSPAKDTVNPEKLFFDKIQNAWDQRIDEPKLRAKLGDGKRPFWDYKNPGKSVVGAATSSNVQAKMWVDNCPHCEGFHPKGTICSYAPCKVCGSVGGVCYPKCTHECKHCKTKGHLEKDCPLNCKYCGKEGGHAPGEKCPELCQICQKENCTCDCQECGKSKQECTCEKICKDCNKIQSLCECGQEDSEIEPYVEDKMVQLILYRKNRSENISYIKEAMDFLDIKKEEL